VDDAKPFKVIKLPTARGACEGLQVVILFECETQAVADTIKYQYWLDDEDPMKPLLYSIEVYHYEP
jgi:hypothetical protein